MSDWGMHSRLLRMHRLQGKILSHFLWKAPEKEKGIFCSGKTRGEGDTVCHCVGFAGYEYGSRCKQGKPPGCLMVVLAYCCAGKDYDVSNAEGGLPTHLGISTGLA